MIFQCGDLDRALQLPGADAGRPRARRDVRAVPRAALSVDGDLARRSAASRGVGEPGSVAADSRRSRSGPAAPQARADLALGAGGGRGSPDRGDCCCARGGSRAAEFLTDEALQQVQQAESAYARSIEKLSQVAGPALEQSPSPLAGAYREKLLVIDSEIADLKATVEGIGTNVYLQTELASLYREKQKTLQEWLEYAKRN